MSSSPMHLIITGEGGLETTRLRGKVVGTVVDLAEDARVEVAIVAGGIDEVDFAPRRVAAIVSLTISPAPRSDLWNTQCTIWSKPARCLGRAQTR
jgi:glycerate kinase